jgi:hypothetical protein
MKPQKYIYMKNILLIAVLVMSLQVSGNSSINHPISNLTEKPQSPVAFSFIRGHKQGRSGYSLQWRMTNNSNIAHFEVLCTYEDPFDPYSNWTNLGMMNNFTANIFKFTHSNVLPGIINYRIIAVLNNGAGTILSDIFTTTID